MDSQVHIAFDITIDNDNPTTVPTKRVAIITMVTIVILIHACLSNRTKQAGQTVKHAFQKPKPKLTRKQARQTAIAITLSSFDGCSCPSESLMPLLCYDDCSLSPSKQATPTAGKLSSSSLIQTDDCSSPSFIDDDCSLSPSAIQTTQKPPSSLIQTAGKPSSSLIQTNNCSSLSFIDDCSLSSPSLMLQYLKKETSNCSSSSNANHCIIDLPLPSINRKPSSASRRLYIIGLPSTLIVAIFSSIINEASVAPFHSDIACRRRHFVATALAGAIQASCLDATALDNPTSPLSPISGAISLADAIQASPLNDPTSSTAGTTVLAGAIEATVNLPPLRLTTAEAFVVSLPSRPTATSP
jgi:hypothetical protein